MYSETKERSFFARVFLNMTWALLLTALTAYGVASYPPFVRAIMSNEAGLFILMALELVLVYTLLKNIFK